MINSKFLLLPLFFLLSSAVYAYTAPDTITYKRPDDRKNVSTKWLRLDLGISTFLYENDFDLPEGYTWLEHRLIKSTDVDIHIIRTKINVIKHTFNVFTGIQVNSNNYRFGNDVTFSPDTDSLLLLSNTIGVKKSKLETTFIKIPLELNIETKSRDINRSWHFTAGGWAGVLVDANTKIKTVSDSKTKHHDGFMLNKFRYGLVGRIGYGMFNVYATYALNNMFQDDHLIHLTPITFGITLIPY